MTNILEILKNLDIEVPSEKQSELTKLVAENYKTVVEVDKKIAKLELERDKWKNDAETNAETLKNFDGKDFDAIQNEVEILKGKLKTANEDYEKKIYDRDFNDLLTKEMANVKFTTELGGESIIQKIKDANLKMQDGKILGLNDYIGVLKEKYPSEFVNEQEEQLKKQQAKFTQPMKPTNNTLTKEDINKVTDRQERLRLISENMSLYGN